jgi:hypothetical protein
MSHLKPGFAALVGGAIVLALLAIPTDADAARKKKPVAKSQTQSNPVRSSYGYQPRAYVPPSVVDYGPAVGTGILHGYRHPARRSRVRFVRPGRLIAGVI